ncbi:hypothetical protein JG688_00015273, partial [Phytophthora aleatoria]
WSAPDGHVRRESGPRTTSRTTAAVAVTATRAGKSTLQTLAAPARASMTPKETFQVLRTRSTKSVVERNKQIKNVQNSSSEHIPDEWQVYAKTIICTHGGKHRYRGKGKRPQQEVRPMGCTTQINAGVQVTIDSLRKTGAKTKSILEFIVENSDSCPTPQDVQNLIRNLKNREQGGKTRSPRVKKWLLDLCAVRGNLGRIFVDSSNEKV